MLVYKHDKNTGKIFQSRIISNYNTMKQNPFFFRFISLFVNNKLELRVSKSLIKKKIIKKQRNKQTPKDRKKMTDMDRNRYVMAYLKLADMKKIM